MPPTATVPDPTDPDALAAEWNRLVARGRRIDGEMDLLGRDRLRGPALWREMEANAAALLRVQAALCALPARSLGDVLLKLRIAVLEAAIASIGPGQSVFTDPAALDLRGPGEKALVSAYVDLRRLVGCEGSVVSRPISSASLRGSP